MLLKLMNIKTSEKNMINGLKNNPINEFEKYVKILKLNMIIIVVILIIIKLKKEIKNFFLWGSKDGLELFFKENNIDKQFKEYMNNTESENKACIIYISILIEILDI